MNNPSICIINVYFGAFPNYFNLFMDSCRHNPTIDFFIATDQPQVENLPSNVRFLSYTLEDMKEKATQILGFPVVLEKPYKCCDYKPLYGLIFQEYIKKYDYWGYCDIDLIFGDIRAFTKEYNLSSYDKFLPLGHMSLLKNTPAVNQAYQLEGGKYSYKQVFSTPKSCFFDEDDGSLSIFLANKYSFFTKRIFADIFPFYHRFIEAPHAFANEPLPQNYKYQTYYWENGKIFRAYVQNGIINTQEYIYIHLQKRPNFSVAFDINTTPAYYITPSGFIPKTGPVTLENIQRTNPFSLWEHARDTILYKRKRLHFHIGQTKWGQYLVSLKRELYGQQ